MFDAAVFKSPGIREVRQISKSALLALTEVLAQGLAPKVRVNAVEAGPVLIDEGRDVEAWEKGAKKMLVGHHGDPLDVAQAVVFLASQSFITGATLRVDGGDFLK